MTDIQNHVEATPSAPPLASCAVQTDFTDNNTTVVTQRDSDHSLAFEWSVASIGLIGFVVIGCFAVAASFTDARSTTHSNMFARRLETYKLLRCGPA